MKFGWINIHAKIYIDGLRIDPGTQKNVFLG